MTAPGNVRTPASEAVRSSGATALRRQAEQHLRRHPAKAGPDLATADSRRLVHELQVHQIELELQNSELLAARDRLEVLLGKYTDLYEFAPVGYFSLGPDSRIHLVNLAGASLLGTDRAQLVGQQLAQHVAPDSRPDFAAFLKGVFAGKTNLSSEVALARPGQALRFVRLEAEWSPGQSECRAMMEDITERKLAEEARRRNEALFLALVTQAPVGVYVVDAELRLIQVNPKAQPVFGRIQPALGRKLSEVLDILWSPRVAQDAMRRFRHTLKTGEPYYSTDFSERRHDSGVTEAYEWQLQRITLPAGAQGVVCFFNDITERKQREAALRRVEALAAANREANKEISRRRAVELSLRESHAVERQHLLESRHLHAQLRHLTRKIITAQEEERKIISRDLHDDVMQTLVGINVELATLTKGAVLGERSLKLRVARTQRIVTQSVSAVHRYARALRPAALDDLGLIPALHVFCKQLAARKKIKIRITAFGGVETLGDAKRVMLFRVAQEALTNVARHAQATRVEISIRKGAGTLRMEICDDGQSFDVNRVMSARNPKRLGLVGMKERIEMEDGTLAITSAPGKGTTVCIEVPFIREKKPS